MKHATQRHFHFDTRSVMLIAAMAVGGATSLHAQTAPSTPKPQTSTFSTGPGSTSPSTPAPSSTTAAFDRADANRDGQLSAQEAQSFPAIGNRFQQFDKNRDGQLSREEFTEGSKS